MINERAFLISTPYASRLQECDSLTCRAYASTNYLWLFDKNDGHLAFKMDKRNGKVLYACDAIPRGLARVLYNMWNARKETEEEWQQLRKSE